MAWGVETNDPFGGDALSTAPAPAPNNSGFASWSGGLFDTLGSLGTAYFNSKAGYPTGHATNYGAYPQINDPYFAPRNRNTMLYIIGGIVLLVVLYIFLKR